MRLTPKEKQDIVKVIQDKDRSAKIYLYGSRSDDTKKGGDIDLLIVSETLGLPDKVDILIELKAQLGEQKIDLSIQKSAEAKTHPFFSKVLVEGIELSVSVSRYI